MPHFKAPPFFKTFPLEDSHYEARNPINDETLGLYTRFKRLLWSNGGIYDDNDIGIARFLIIHVNKWRAVKKELLQKDFINIKEGRLYIPELVTQIREMQDKSNKGKVNAAKRHGQNTPVEQVEDFTIDVNREKPSTEALEHHKKDKAALAANFNQGNNVTPIKKFK